MRVIVCGSRHYGNREHVFATLRTVLADHPDVTIIQGGALGVDAIAKSFAEEYEIPCEQYDAQWGIYGKAAGPIRNRRMLEEGNADYVIAFMTGAGPGTKNMVRQAIEHGTNILQVHD